jgi:hypothetical protein
MQLVHARRVLLDVGHDEVVKDLLDKRVVVLQVGRDHKVRLGDDVRQVMLIEVGDQL